MSAHKVPESYMTTIQLSNPLQKDVNADWKLHLFRPPPGEAEIILAPLGTDIHMWTFLLPPHLLGKTPYRDVYICGGDDEFYKSICSAFHLE